MNEVRENAYKTVWYDSVLQIKQSDWDIIFPSEVLKSTTIFKTMEDSFEKTIKYHYLCVYINNDIVAILPCFEYILNLEVVAPNNIQKHVNRIRQYIKGFFSVRVFVLGSYIATCEQYIGIADGYRDGQLSFIKDMIEAKSKELKCKIIMIKEVPAPEQSYIKRLFDNFLFVDSLPNSFIPLKRFSPYPSSLSTKAKQRYNRAKRDFKKNNIRFEVYQNFEEYSKIACTLYTNVLNKSHTQFERLNEDFFSNVNNNFKDNSYLLVARDSNNIIRSIELIFQCDHKLIPIYIGIDYSYHDVKCLYFNTIAFSVEFAEKNKCDYVVLGQNNYFPKALSGAILQRGFLGFHSTHWFYSLLIKKYFNVLFPVFKNEAGIFYNKNAYDSLQQFCSEYNVNMLPDQRSNKQL